MRGRRLLATTLALAAALPASAGAAEAPPGAVALAPDTAGRASAFEVELGPEVLGQTPQGNPPNAVSLLGTPGLKIDPRAVAGRCSDAQADRFDCPSASRIGSGSAQGHAEGALVPGGRYDFTASILVFLAPPRASGDLAGVVLQVSEPQSGQRFNAKGRIRRDPAFGWETRFEGLAGGGQLPPGVTVKLDRITLRVAANRTVRKRVTVRRNGKRRRVIKRFRYSLLTNPRTCTGAWPYRLRVEYADRTDEYDGAAPCRTP